jgi:hypothetical protein
VSYTHLALLTMKLNEPNHINKSISLLKQGIELGDKKGLLIINSSIPDFGHVLYERNRF